MLPDGLVDWQAVDQLTHTVHGDAATWWLQATPGVNYYRAEMPAKHLPGRTVRLHAPDVQETKSGKVWFPRQAGASVWMFSGNMTRWILMAEMRNQGIPVWMEVDDNYTVHPPVASQSTWLRKRDTSGGDQSSYECHVEIVKSVCDGVIVSTPRLADVYRRLHSNVVVCRNSVDPADWPDQPPHQPDGVLRIGWAGSPSHAYDLHDIQRALSWAAGQPDVEVVTIGYDHLFPFPYRHLGWTDSLAEHRRNVENIDVMLCPLRPSAYADCKSDVKALEAAMGGGCAVVSKVEAYRPWWDGEAPGYVADAPKDFLKIVKHLVRNRDETRQAAAAAREYALSMRDIRSTIRFWREALCA